MSELDSRVQKVLDGKCWAKDCSNGSDVPAYFKKIWENLEKPVLCLMHSEYRYADTHYGTWDAAQKKWSCCEKTHQESLCGDIDTVLGPYKHRIEISAEQQASFDKRLRALEGCVESNYCSENWDRS
ncbi:hypothetical protein EON65_53170 [archaeon]|nr:MAG: hypothetical protein EON65_53170 [archaeon]